MRWKSWIAAFLLSAASPMACPNEQAIVTPRYHSCNVFLSDSCFGIAPSDHLVMTIPADFALYEIELPHGLSALVYSGYSPDIKSDELMDRYDVCVEVERRCSLSNIGASTIEAVYSYKRGQPATHVRILGVTEENIALARHFLANFRSYKKGRPGSGSLFKDVVERPKSNA